MENKKDQSPVKEFLHFRESLPTILMLTLLSLSAVYVYFWGEGTKVFWSGFMAILVFYGLTFFTGSYIARRHSNSEKGNDAILGGRNIPLWVSVFTMAATWLGGGYINGSAEATYKSGLVWLQAPWGYAASLVLGGIFFAKIMRKFKYRTMLDPLEQRFGKKMTAVLFLPALVGELFWTAAILSALGSTFGIVIGLDFEVSVILSAAVAIGYTALGGLWAVALTDVIQLSLLFLGLGIILPFIIDSSGGIVTTWTAYSAKWGASASFLPSTEALGTSYWLWWDYAFLLVLGGIPWHSYFQRVLAAKTDKAAVSFSILAGFICLFAAVPPIIIGMVGGVTDWTSFGGPPENSLNIMPYVMKYLTPTAIATIGLAAVATAVMSSVDSSILSASSMSVWNIYRPLIDPNIKGNRINQLVKLFVWVNGILATMIALKVQSIYTLWILCSDFVYCLLFPALVTALFDKKANFYGALAGFSIAFLLRFGGGEPSLGIPTILPYPILDSVSELAQDGTRIAVLFPFRTFAMFMGLISIILVSRMTQKISPPIELSLENSDELLEK
ncbi:MAG: sodium:solute symporter family protein [Leptospiraceae bacterium]|nr:sodium:solute symporter family protein [Leptospiraceae bacterium]